MDVTNKLSKSTRLMLEEAERMGINCQIIQEPYLIRMSHNNKVWFTMASRASVQSSVGKEIADNKLLSKQLLKYYDIPTAPYVYLDGHKTTHKVEKLDPPFVLKPIRGSAGNDVYTGLSESDEIKSIIEENVKSKWLVEEHLSGNEYRVVCVDFKMVAAAERIPAFVVGDGHSTIKHLINKKNRQPHRGDGHFTFLAKILFDDDLHLCLAKQKKNLSDVLKKGENVYLRSVCNMSQGGEAVNITNKVCRENRQLFERISRLVDLNIIGIDIMADSLETPIATQIDSGVIEINASPGLDIHEAPYMKNKVQVSKAILELCIREAKVLA